MRQHPGERESRELDASRRGPRTKLVEPGEHRIRPQVLVGFGPLRHPRIGGRRLVRVVLAGQPTAGERAVRLVGDVEVDAQRDHVVLVAAVEQRVRVLHDRRPSERERRP